MDNYYELALEAASYIESLLPKKPCISIVLGSGLGLLADNIQNGIEINYKDIPNFPQTTVEGHEGKLIAGMLGGKCLLALKGRFHYYEGYDIQQVIFPIRVLKLLEIQSLIVTNAAGGINEDFTPGDLMLIRDHISLFAPSPLRGRNIDNFGERFPDMSQAYDRTMLELAGTIGIEKGIDLKEGVYAFAQGPMFETPAEIRALKVLGADAVGMSTVPEVITARHAGIKVLGISCITNMAAGLGGLLSHEDVSRTANEVGEKFSNLITGLLEAF